MAPPLASTVKSLAFRERASEAKAVESARVAASNAASKAAKDAASAAAQPVPTRGRALRGPIRPSNLAFDAISPLPSSLSALPEAAAPAAPELPEPPPPHADGCEDGMALDGADETEPASKRGLAALSEPLAGEGATTKRARTRTVKGKDLDAAKAAGLGRRAPKPLAEAAKPTAHVHQQKQRQESSGRKSQTKATS